MCRAVIAISSFVVVVLLFSQPAKAAIVEVDVTIKTVDAKAHGITVSYEVKGEQKTIDLDVSRKADIKVNGKSETLDSVKPGQKAKISYEKELQVVTKIDATGSGTAPGREVCRFMLSVSEFGDCVLKVEQTSTPIASATKFDGTPMKLAFLPNAEVLKASDGRCRIIHSFDHSDPLSAILLDGSRIRRAELDRSTATLTLTPQKDGEVFLVYGSWIQLPTVLCYDRLPIQDRSGVFLTLRVGRTFIGDLGVHLGRGDDGKTLTHVSWDVIDQKNRKMVRTQILDPAKFDIAEGCERKFRLPLPNVRIEENCRVCLGAWSDEGERKADLLNLLVQGHLHPDLGIGFGEQMSMIFAQWVTHGGFAEKAGLKVGDVVLSIDGQQPKSEKDAFRLSVKASIGDEIRFKIRRGDEEHELTVVIE